MPKGIESKIDDMYEPVKKSGSELINDPKPINEKVYQHQKKTLKKKEQAVIKALGRKHPGLAAEIEENLQRKKHGAIKEMVRLARIEVEINPNGDEIYRVDGEKFLKVTRETKPKENGVRTVVKFELK